ncbi:MAG: DUF1194 domain-containing protein, partial [Syntrophobacteraceae bacterium]|nr:DUF1194 domain-containing protein [Syntrophobacteraceae bacterium]
MLRAALLLCLTTTAARACETALLLSIDVSGSIDAGDYRLQTEGLAAALRLLEDVSYASPRNVVDISGDGAESPAREYVVLMPQARSMAIARGVTVNGLAILGSEDGLEDWYRANV